MCEPNRNPCRALIVMSLFYIENLQSCLEDETSLGGSSSEIESGDGVGYDYSDTEETIGRAEQSDEISPDMLRRGKAN